MDVGLKSQDSLSSAPAPDGIQIIRLRDTLLVTVDRDQRVKLRNAAIAPFSVQPRRGSHKDLRGFIDRCKAADRVLNGGMLRLLRETDHPRHKQQHDQNGDDNNQFQ